MTSEFPSPPVWTEPIKIRSYDVDSTHSATPDALCRYFLEAAWNHAEALGVGFTHLATQDRIWVLSRLLLRIERFPKWGDALTVRTWPRPTQSLFAMRDFQFLDDAGTARLAGSSAWIVLNRTSRRPQRLDSLLGPRTRFTETRALDRDPEKLATCNPVSPGLPLTALYSDMDVNSHVNSARYLGMLLDAYPLEFHQAHSLGELEVNYLAETRAGDTLTVAGQEIAPCEFYHSISKTNSAEVCRAKITWRKR